MRKPHRHLRPPPVVPPEVANNPELDSLSPEMERAYALLVDTARDQAIASDLPQKQGNNTVTRLAFAGLPTRARLIRFALDFFAGARAAPAMASNGLTWGDIQIGKLASPDYKRVFDLCQDARDQLLALKAQATAEAALDGEEVSNGSIQLVRFLLERLRRKSYGDPRYGQAGSGGGAGGVIYEVNISNAQFLGGGPPPPPKMCGKCADALDGPRSSPPEISITGSSAIAYGDRGMDRAEGLAPSDRQRPPDSADPDRLGLTGIDPASRPRSADKMGMRPPPGR